MLLNRSTPGSLRVCTISGSLRVYVTEQVNTRQSKSLNVTEQGNIRQATPRPPPPICRQVSKQEFKVFIPLKLRGMGDLTRIKDNGTVYIDILFYSKQQHTEQVCMTR